MRKEISKCLFMYFCETALRNSRMIRWAFVINSLSQYVYKNMILVYIWPCISTFDIRFFLKVHRKASQIRRPQESPPHKLGYPPGSKPPRLVLKSASLIHGLNNNSVHAKEPNEPPPLHSPFEESSQQQYLDFLDIPEVVFARQLTRMDCVSYINRCIFNIRCTNRFPIFCLLPRFVLLKFFSKMFGILNK